MTNILVHGLGQNEKSWDKVKSQLQKNNINIKTPNLFLNMKNLSINYNNMYKSFADYCNKFEEKINLVGISLGGVLVLDYVTEFPEKVNSIVLIGTPSKIPKVIYAIQNFIYKFIPKTVFEKMGCSKKDIINLLSSMSKLSIKDKALKIKCNTMIVCGKKDLVNIKSAKELNKIIENSNLQIINDSGHEVNLDNPKELSNVILNFWKIKKVC